MVKILTIYYIVTTIMSIIWLQSNVEILHYKITKNIIVSIIIGWLIIPLRLLIVLTRKILD